MAVTYLVDLPVFRDRFVLGFFGQVLVECERLEDAVVPLKR